MIAVVTGERLLDLRGVPVRDRDRAVLAAFDRLAPGHTMRLVADVDPLPFFDLLEEERHGLFDWIPVESGPDLWRLDVGRRGLELSDSPTIHGKLAADHAHAHALERAAFRARASGEMDVAVALGRDLLILFDRHRRMEEELVFPLVAERLPEAVPLDLLHQDHAQAKETMEQLVAALGEPGDAAEKLQDHLHELFAEHEAREEVTVYEALGNRLGRRDVEDLLRRIELFQ